MQGLVPLVLIYLLLAAWIISTVYQYRQSLSGMAGMTAAMALGMGIGLGLGSLIAAWIPGQFALATALGMGAGAIAGALTGAPVGMMAVLDGLLSGVMAGMMGAMLTEMMPPGDVALTVQWMVVLYSVIIFIIFLMLHQAAHTGKRVASQAFWQRPVTLFLVVVIVILFTLQHDLNLTRELLPPSVHTH
ncbi:hypothetical protein [Paenibacillus sp. J2TS4]|uniref:hypothetical protein n=1 Tax=Paenibacillus sp. J2TS4 TaxID=2807194 RepID=UPI001AFF9748|nr:hypothetical protein [Paenibacillus sp. J2TS4]GIP31528.1 hypothetical protein J2TS4_07380 [Paenibacillus sp. J2TS4]